MADRERLERCGEEHSHAGFGLNVQIVGDLKIVDDGVENLIDAARAGNQAGAFEAVENVVFRLALPGAETFDRRRIGNLRALVLNVSRLNRKVGELLGALLGRGVAPEAGERFEVRFVNLHEVRQLGFFAVDFVGQPEVRAGVDAPAIEVHIHVAGRRTTVGSVEAHDVAAAVFNPDIADEVAAASAFQRSDREDERADIAEEFAAQEVELIVIAVEGSAIEQHHLSEAFWQIADGEEAREQIEAAAGRRRFREIGSFADAVRQIDFPEEVVVSGGDSAEIRVGREFLNVRFNDGCGPGGQRAKYSRGRWPRPASGPASGPALWTARMRRVRQGRQGQGITRIGSS